MSNDFGKAYMSKSVLEQSVGRRKVKGNIFLAIGLILFLLGSTIFTLIAKDLMSSNQTAGTVLRYDEDRLVEDEEVKPYILISHKGNLVDTDHMPYGPAGEWKAGQKVEMLVLPNGEMALKNAVDPRKTTGIITAASGIPLIFIGARSRRSAKKQSQKLGY